MWVCIPERRQQRGTVTLTPDPCVRRVSPSSLQKQGCGKHPLSELCLCTPDYQRLGELTHRLLVNMGHVVQTLKSMQGAER